MMEPLNDPVEHITQLLSSAIKTAFPEITHVSQVSLCKNHKFGDYQSPVSMYLLKSLRNEQFKTAYDIALHLVKHLPQQFLINVQVSSNGYINFTLTTVYLRKFVSDILTLGCPPPSIKNKDNVIIDFSSPNIAKEMHVGHLRSTIIGESLARLLEYCGYSVSRINHIGDWGTPFGMLIAYLKKVRSDYLVNNPSITDLQKFYKLAKSEFDENDEFAKEARNEVVKLQSGDSVTLQSWKLLCQISMNAFQQIYDCLSVSLTTQGESYYNSLLPAIVNMIDGQKYLTEDKQGEFQHMKCFFIPNHKQPLILQKSDSAYTYDTTDLAAIYHRLIQKKANWIIYVVDSGQSSHFNLLFKAAELMGWHRPPETKLTHVTFGVVCGPDGKRFKTRSGETVKLIDLLNEAVSRAKRIIIEKNADLSETEVNNISKAVGYSAIRYADLRSDRNTNYIFSFEKMLDFKGNTAVYLLYAYARICSILHKGKSESPGEITLIHETEILLTRILYKYQLIIRNAIDTLQLNGMCEYVYEIATQVMAFHRDCHVLGDPLEASRLNLLEATRRIMKLMFDLLGIVALDKI